MTQNSRANEERHRAQDEEEEILTPEEELRQIAETYCALDTDLPIDWTPEREQAAWIVAMGYTQAAAAEAAGVSRRTLVRWMRNPHFRAEIDRMTLMIGISTRAERLRIAMAVARQRINQETGEFRSDRDLLEWLKFARDETDGANLNLLTPVFTAMEGENEGE